MRQINWLFRPLLKMTIPAALVLLGAVLVFVSKVDAGIATRGLVAHVNTTFIPGDFSSQPSLQVVALPDGGFVVVWNGPGEVFQWPAIGRHFDATGTAVGGEFQLEGVRGSREIAQHGNGMVVEFAEQVGAMLADFTADGALNSVEPIAAFSSLIATPQQDFIAVWSESFQITGQRFGADLSASGSSFVVVSASDPGDEYLDAPAVAADPHGGFVAVWWAQNSSALWARQFDAQNMPLGDPFPVVEPGQLAELIGGPPACVDESGEFVVAWQDQDHWIEFRRYDAWAHPLTPRLSTSLTSDYNTDGVSLACLPQGRFVVVGRTGTGVGGRVFDAQSRPVGEFSIPALTGVSPTVTAFPDATLLVAWAGCFAGGTPGCDVFAQQFAVTTSPDCSGDCNGDGVVTVDDIVGAVNIALEDTDISACFSVDTDLDGRVTVIDLVAAVNRALEGCG
jgi:hypothetical protein